VSATVKEKTFNLLSVKLFYSSNGGATFDSTVMTSPDSVYTGDITSIPDGTVVDYYVETWNDGGFATHRPPVGTYDLYVGTETIREVQGSLKADGDSSAYAGTPVNVSGLVTAAPGEYSDYYFFIQEPYVIPDTPAYKGIKVYDRTGSLSLSRGDSVTVCGDIWEYFNETELALHFSQAIAVHSTGGQPPDPFEVATSSIDVSEEWEGVLLNADCSTVKAIPDKFGEWKITNRGPADTCRVGDAGAYTYSPQVNDLVDVVGIGMYAYGKYILQPRDDSDISVPQSGIDDEAAGPVRLSLALAPNPLTSGTSIKLAIPVSGVASLKVYNVQGRLVRTIMDGRFEAGEYNVDWNGANSAGRRVASGIYFMKLETQKGSLVKKMVVSR
jgi:hypothetical protein